MSGMQHMTPEQMEKAFQEMSPDKLEELKRNLEAGNTVQKPAKAEADKDYTVRRKRIYKGKMSPQGYVWLVVNVKTKTRKLESCQMIPGGMGSEFEKGAAEGLRELIREKHKV